MSALELFHFMRPWVLVLLIPSWGFIWWLLRQQDDIRQWEKIVNPKLLPHLIIEPKKKRATIPTPYHLGIVLSLMIFALSAPSWQLKPSPFTQDKAEVVFAIKVSKSMLSSDLSPSRLSRAILKIKDILSLRADIKASLIAYSGSAHLVLPLTNDHNILEKFAQSLSPEIMPLEGDNISSAISLATAQLSSYGGTVIILADSIELNKKLPKLKYSPNLIFLAIGSKELLDISKIEKDMNKLDGKVQIFTKDSSDIEQIDSWIDRAFKSSGGKDATLYIDGGYYFLPFILFLMLFWFRRGFLSVVWRG